ncbi:MAG: DUF4115 domain-containing protein [Armatimonadetes bacterium]|nr:DUF4115 domain-containing protein [Armatimonadota bacterium]
MVESIGDILRQAREKRGLSVQDAHEATKIMVKSISDLEQNRFDAFANKVYARAFLRDYANYLNLDSAALLEAYEQQWAVKPASEPAVTGTKSGTAWKAFGYTLLIILVCAGVAFCAWKACSLHRAVQQVKQESNLQETTTTDVATMPRAEPVAPPKPSPVENTPQPATPPPPVAPQKLVVDVSALMPVWIGVKVDGKTVTQQILAKEKTVTFEGKQSVTVRAGMAGAVQIKVNGQTQPSLGSMKTPGEKTFTIQESAATAQPSSQ